MTTKLFDQEVMEAETMVLVIGNPVDGLAFVGPFTDVVEIEGYVESVDSKDWWIAKLVKP